MYRSRQVFQVLLTCCLCNGAFCQTDSVSVLEEVAIVGIDLSKFSEGTVIQRVPSMSTGALGEIGRLSTIHFKNYGNQQLSTITFRGTSASHTNVVWNGIQVNSPTLGQTDFSVWPMFLTNEIIIQSGGGSSLFGSGAIGGTIILDNSTIRKDSLLTFYGAHGSFGQWDGGAKVQLDISENFRAESRFFYGTLENDFPLEGGGRQVHASVKRIGVSQKFQLDHKKGRLFSEIAFAENDRNIQPTITSADRSTLRSRNLRSVINHQLNIGSSRHYSTVGLIMDETVFNDSSITRSHRLMGSYTVEQEINQSLFTRIGGSIIHEWAQSDNFIDANRENQYHLFASATAFISSDFSMTLNLRQAMQQDRNAFIPALGFNYMLLSNDDQTFSFRGQLSRDYRIPTLNDLHWQPGGNEDLQPELSENVEVGFDWMSPSFTFSVTGFYSDIQDWIQWRQIEGIFTPLNLRKVRTKGIEANSSFNIAFQDWKLSAQSAYTFVLSEDQGLNETNQLPYVPKHEVFGNLTASYKDYHVSLTGNFTSVRYTTLTNSRASEIDEFFLMDFAISRAIRSRLFNLDVRLSSNNILNSDYQVVKNRAMPGRSFLIELTTKF